MGNRTPAGPGLHQSNSFSSSDSVTTKKIRGLNVDTDNAFKDLTTNGSSFSDLGLEIAKIRPLDLLRKQMTMCMAPVAPKSPIDVWEEESVDSDEKSEITKHRSNVSGHTENNDTSFSPYQQQ